MTDINSVYTHSSKSNLYIKGIRKSFSGLEPSIRHFLQKTDINGMTILDAGCAAGGMYEALSEIYPDIRYTGIDLDKKCIEHAQKIYPKAVFRVMDFMDNSFKDNSFDAVMIYSWSHMVPQWKQLFRQACRISRRFIFFDIRLRLEGSTVIDMESSFQFYHKSLRRNHYIVHNLYELLAFFHVEDLNLKNISAYAYILPGKTTAILPLPSSKVMVGSFRLEKYSPQQASKVKRYGTRASAAGMKWVNLNIDIPGYEE